MPFVAVATAFALLCATGEGPKYRAPAADPTKAPGSQAVELVDFVNQQIDFMTNSMSDMQLYATGNLLFWGGFVVALGAAYAWRKAGASPMYRANRTGNLLPKLDALVKKLEAAQKQTYDQALRSTREHIRSIDAGIPFRREILAAMRSTDGEDAVEKLLLTRPDIQAALRRHPQGNLWLSKYLLQRDSLKKAEVIELHAKGVRFDEAATKLREFFKTSKIPPGLPFQAEFRGIDTPHKYQKWLDRPEVQRFLDSDRPEIVAWRDQLRAHLEREDRAFKEMQAHYRSLVVEVMQNIDAVDKTGAGLVYMERLVQPQLKYDMDRDPLSHEEFGKFYTLNDGHYAGVPSGREVFKTLVHLDKQARNLEHQARTELGKACRQRLEWLTMLGGGAVAVAVGWGLRGASNRRLHDTRGKTGDQIVADGREAAKAEGDAKAKDNAEPPAVAARLAAARQRREETELRDFYALMREKLREKDNLPHIAKVVSESGFVSKDALDAAEFGSRTNKFMKDNDFADSIIDAGIAHAMSGKASDVPAIKELLFGNDRTKDPFRVEARGHLYPMAVRSLWPTVVPSLRPFGLEDHAATMLKETQPDLQKIGERFRARPPAPRPTDVFRNP